FPREEEPVQSFLSCNRCRGRKMGWDGRYILHQVVCRQWVSKSSKLLILTVVLASVIFGFSAPSALVSPGEARIPELIFPVSFAPVLDPAVGMIETFLQRHQVNPSRWTRVAESIVTSARKYSLDPKLIASIMIVESRADPFAISAKDSIGIMQIHLPTWGPI